MIDINTILSRTSVINEDLGNECILLNSDNTMFTLNETAKYIWKICDGKSIDAIAKQVYDACINKYELNFDDIRSDCINVIEIMFQQGFVKLKE